MLGGCTVGLSAKRDVISLAEGNLLPFTSGVFYCEQSSLTLAVIPLASGVMENTIDNLTPEGKYQYALVGNQADSPNERVKPAAFIITFQKVVEDRFIVAVPSDLGDELLYLMTAGDDSFKVFFLELDEALAAAHQVTLEGDALTGGSRDNQRAFVYEVASTMTLDGPPVMECRL